MNVAVVRPLVDNLYDPDDASIGRSDILTFGEPFHFLIKSTCVFHWVHCICERSH